ncbi:hypothetical protein NW754_014592, partial [Fusarium falciforme]
EGVLKLTAKLSPYNAPLVIADRTWVSATLQGAGLVNGRFSQPKGTNLTAASLAAKQFRRRRVLLFQGIFKISAIIGCTHRRRISAIFQSAYVTRYNIAATGYLALTRDQAMYPAYVSSTINNIIPSTSALRLTFSAKPKLKPHGFWSLTIYDVDAYLIPNDLDRYTLGDRSNFTLMDGSISSSSEDGPFQILIQPSNVPPPANWTSNWLPAPADRKGFQMNLRFYGGEEAMANGSYVYPLVETIDAIIA